MIVVIRISGQVEISPQAKEAMHRMKMRRKFVAVLLEETKDNMMKIKDLRNYVAYGKITEEMLKNLLEKRAESLTGKKIDASKHHTDIGKKDYEKIGIKPFFRLHPPIGGIDQKHHFGVGKGILGDNGDKINELLRRML